MKLLLDDMTARKHNLNANEACVFAAILKCTKAGRGWFANYRDLADALPFVINRMTVSRAVTKLLNLGLVRKDENGTLFAAQIVHTDEQIVHTDEQIVHDDAQNVQISPSPYNPLINNNDMNENKNATCAHTCDTRTPENPSFFELRREFSMKGGGSLSIYQEMLANDEWNKCSPAKKIKLFEALKAGKFFKPRIDWLIADFPEPQPEFLRGDEPGRIVQVRYNGMFKLCTPETMKLFGLEYVQIWK